MPIAPYDSGTVYFLSSSNAESVNFGSIKELLGIRSLLSSAILPSSIKLSK